MANYGGMDNEQLRKELLAKSDFNAQFFGWLAVRTLDELSHDRDDTISEDIVYVDTNPSDQRERVANFAVFEYMGLSHHLSAGDWDATQGPDFYKDKLDEFEQVYTERMRGVALQDGIVDRSVEVDSGFRYDVDSGLNYNPDTGESR